MNVVMHSDIKESKRRHFCNTSLVGEANSDTMAPLNVGIMGYGFSTKCFNLPFILPNPDLKVYAFLQRAEAPADKSSVAQGKHCTVDYPEAKHYRTPEDFFADSNIDLVVVCTKHDTHEEFAEMALAAGKHGKQSLIERTEIHVDDLQLLWKRPSPEQLMLQII